MPEVKRVCLITTGHLATNPRLMKEADALAEVGLEVSVIFGDFVPWARRMDLCLDNKRWRIAAKLPFGPDGPLFSRLKHVLRQKPAKWLVSRGIGPKPVLAAASHPIAADLEAAALSNPADLYVAHYVGALPAAAVAARRLGVSYAYDAEDFHLGDWPDGEEHEVERRIVRGIEGEYLSEAAYVTAASPMIADALVESYGIERPYVVLNTFPVCRAPCAPTPAGSSEPGPSLYWFSQTIGPNRGLESAVRAIGMSRSKPHLYLQGTPAAGYVDSLMRLAAETGAGTHLHILPPIVPQSIERHAAMYDLGLCSEPGGTKNNLRALSNKLFTFLLAGLPPLLSDTPAQSAFAKEAGITDLIYPRESAYQLANLIDQLLVDRGRLKTTRERTWSLGQTRYNWNKEQSNLLSAVWSVKDMMS